MSILIHYCTKCSHDEWQHEARGKGYTSCQCCKNNGRADIDPEPTLVETYPADGRPVGTGPEALYDPGSTWNPSTAGAQRLCGCDACVARARQEQEADRWD